MSVMGFPWYSQVVGPFLSHAHARVYYYLHCVLIQNCRVNSHCCYFTANKARVQIRVSVTLRLFVATSFTPFTFRNITSNLFTTDSFQILAISY